MKTILFGKNILLLAVTILLYNCSNKQVAEKIETLLPIKADTLPDEESMRKGLMAEDILDRWQVRVDTSLGKNLIERTPYFLRLNGIALPFLASEIDTNETNRMHDIAQALVPVSCTTSTVTGLRILYGSDSNNQLKLYYQPLMFCFVDSTFSPPLGVKGRYRLEVEGLYYHYEQVGGSLQFSEAESVQMSADLARYKDENTGLGIMRDGTNTFDYFRESDWFDGDTRSTVFTFQQIKDIYRSTVCNGFVRFWNAPAKILKYNPPHYIRHILLLSTDNVTEVAGEINHGGNHFSDLCHLCPISCNGEKFSFYLSH